MNSQEFQYRVINALGKKDVYYYLSIVFKNPFRLIKWVIAFN